MVKAALLHDVGRVFSDFTPILRKPRRQTEHQFAIMKTCSRKSADLIGKGTHFADLVPIVLSHHEAWDGSGYPNGIATIKIPVGARTISIVDKIDAMSTSRPYRTGVPTQAVMQELSERMGKQFDPDICRRLLVGWGEMGVFIHQIKEKYPVSKEVEATPERAQLVA